MQSIAKESSTLQIARANISKDGKGIFIEVALSSSNRSNPLDLAYEVVGYPGYKEARANILKSGFRNFSSRPGKSGIYERIEFSNEEIMFGTKYYFFVRHSPEVVRDESDFSDPVTIECPENAWCGRDDVSPDKRGAPLEKIRPMFGSWRASPANASIPQFWKCRYAAACIGYRDSEHDSKHPDGCNEKLGYEGVLCHTCSEGFSRSGDDMCKPCVDGTAWIYALCVLMFAVVIAFIVRRVRSAMGRRLGQSKNREVELLKIFLNGLYGLGALSSFPLEFPEIMDGFFRTAQQLASLSSEAFSTECFVKSHDKSSSRFYIVSLGMQCIPIAAVVASVLIWLAIYFLRSKLDKRGVGGGSKKRRAKQARKRRIGKRRLKKQIVANFTITCVATLFIAVPSLNRSAIKMITCEHIGDKFLLAADPSVECFSRKYMTWMLLLAVPSLMLYSVAMPILGIVTLI